jgi:hypothetical protein
VNRSPAISVNRTQTAPAGIYTLTGGSAASGTVWFSGSYDNNNGTTEPAILTGG